MASLERYVYHDGPAQPAPEQNTSTTPSREGKPVVTKPSEANTVPPEAVQQFYETLKKLENTYKPDRKMGVSDRKTQAIEVSSGVFASLLAAGNLAWSTVYSLVGPAVTYLRYLVPKLVRGAKENTGSLLKVVNTGRKKERYEYWKNNFKGRMWNLPDMAGGAIDSLKGLGSDYLMGLPRRWANDVILKRGSIARLLERKGDEAMEKMSGKEAADKLPISLSGIIFQYGLGDAAVNLSKDEKKGVENLLHAGSMSHALYMKAVGEHEGDKAGYAKKLLKRSVRGARWEEFKTDMRARFAASVGTFLPVVGVAAAANFLGDTVVGAAQSLWNTTTEAVRGVVTQ